MVSLNPAWLEPGAVVPVDMETTSALVNALREVLGRRRYSWATAKLYDSEGNLTKVRMKRSPESEWEDSV